MSSYVVGEKGVVVVERREEMEKRCEIMWLYMKQ